MAAWFLAVLGSLLRLAFGSVPAVASSWKFSYDSICSIWWPDSWKCTSDCCGHGSVEVYTYPCLGSFTYHRGRLVVIKFGGVITGTHRCGHGSFKCTCRCLVFEVFPQRCRRLVLGSLCSVWFGSVPAVAAMVEGSLCTYHGLRSPTYLRGRRFLGSVCVVLEIISAFAAAWFLEVYVASGLLVLREVDLPFVAVSVLGSPTTENLEMLPTVAAAWRLEVLEKFWRCTCRCGHGCLYTCRF